MKGKEREGEEEEKEERRRGKEKGERGEKREGERGEDEAEQVRAEYEDVHLYIIFNFFAFEPQSIVFIYFSSMYQLKFN